MSYKPLPFEKFGSPKPQLKIESHVTQEEVDKSDYQVVFLNSRGNEVILHASNDFDTAVEFANNVLSYYRSATNTELVDYAQSYVFVYTPIASARESCDRAETTMF